MVEKNLLFLAKILWFLTVILYSWGWIKPRGVNDNDSLATPNWKLSNGLKLSSFHKNFALLNSNIWKSFWPHPPSRLGTPVCTNIDEFLEKFQTAFDPPPPPLFWEKCCDFFLRKFLERKWPPQIGVSNAKNFATKFFGSEITPPPPFWNFSKNSSIMVQTGFPYNNWLIS